MGTNFYWLQEACPTCGYVEDRMDPEIHIGKRSAAGLYCWDCEITLCKQGTDGIHDDDADWYDKCPKCGKEPEYEGWESSAGRELGFATSKPKKKTGVKSCASFTWAQKSKDVIKKAKANLDKKIIIDEYGRTYTGKEFLQVLEECPIQFKEIGRWFS